MASTRERKEKRDKGIKPCWEERNQKIVRTETRGRSYQMAKKELKKAVAIFVEERHPPDKR